MIQFLKKYKLTEFALLLVAILGRVLLMKLLFIIGIIVASCKWELNKYMRSKAYIIDVEANVTGKHTWNLLLRKKGGHDFGDPVESMSYAIGRNNRKRKETLTSEIIEDLLLESSEADHCEKAVQFLDKKLADRLLNYN